LPTIGGPGFAEGRGTLPDLTSWMTPPATGTWLAVVKAGDFSAAHAGAKTAVV
jgi:hypothetical protein